MTNRVDIKDAVWGCASNLLSGSVSKHLINFYRWNDQSIFRATDPQYIRISWPLERRSRLEIYRAAAGKLAWP